MGFVLVERTGAVVWIAWQGVVAIHAAALVGLVWLLFVVRRRPVEPTATGSSSDHRRRSTDLLLSEPERSAAHARIAGLISAAGVDVALQPIVAFGTGRIIGVEALSRFADGRPPDIWFREAAETGQGLALDTVAFFTALDTFASIPEHCFLSVNATPELLADGAFHDRLSQAAIPAERLVIEITEHERVADYVDLESALGPARRRGVRLAVDDTGAGYASLNHVLQLRPDIIKLDRSLVSHLASDPARRTLVTALVLLALELGAAVTGEGVEGPLELETLASLGVDHAQGYLMSRPTTDRSEWASWWERQWLPAYSTVRG